jgi:hypothetical protein
MSIEKRENKRKMGGISSNTQRTSCTDPTSSPSDNAGPLSYIQPCHDAEQSYQEEDSEQLSLNSQQRSQERSKQLIFQLLQYSTVKVTT